MRMKLCILWAILELSVLPVCGISWRWPRLVGPGKLP
jgi:hypothetical protein